MGERKKLGRELLLFGFLLFDLGEVLLGEFGDDAGQREDRDEVRDGHEAVEGIGKVPDDVEGRDGGDDDEADEDDLIRFDGLHAEEELDAARTVQRPA